MTDTTETVEEVAPAETVATDTPTDSPDLAAEAEKWKALARKNEQRAKENADKAKRFDEFEEAQKTEQQKLTERAERAEQALAAAEVGRLRASIAAKHGVPEALLTGSTEEALEEAATALLAFKGVPPTAPSSEGQGKQGDPISSQVKQITSLDELSKLTPAEVNQARREGRLEKLLGNS
jgi:phenylalanyl-tRNA synthetase alpha subunit